MTLIKAIVEIDYYTPSKVNVSFNPPDEYWRFDSKDHEQQCVDRLFQTTQEAYGDLISYNRFCWGNPTALTLQYKLQNVLNDYISCNYLWTIDKTVCNIIENNIEVESNFEKLSEVLKDRNDMKKHLSERISVLETELENLKSELKNLN